jgi:hypothetical protein
MPAVLSLSASNEVHAGDSTGVPFTDKGVMGGGGGVGGEEEERE